MLLAMPNSGSDLLIRCIRQVIPPMPYFENKEFFNPICNLPDTDKLRDMGFGCELYPYNIWNKPSAEADQYVEDEIGKYYLWKDVFWFGKADFFTRHFNCCILTRGLDVFPPSRLRVLQWYDAIYGQTSKHGQVGLLKRVYLSHQLAYNHSTKIALEKKIPHLSSSWLQKGVSTGKHIIQRWIGCSFTQACDILDMYEDLYDKESKIHVPYSLVPRDGELVIEGFHKNRRTNPPVV